ncbi:MAG: beta-lactamase family protein [Chloroflexi bacterium]|nr:beta-lactamase family protein [Chloroflexota bacterium]
MSSHSVFVSGSYPAVSGLYSTHLKQGLHLAAALAVFHRSRLEIDLSGGVREPGSGSPAGPDTLFVGFSCGKPLAAACLWVLKERGRISWDKSVANYWPEFGSGGKEGITVRDVLTHRAGLPTTPKPVEGTGMTNFGRAVQALVEASPEYPPGTAIQYHSVTFGWLVGELVQRVSGRSFREFFESEVKAPLGLRDTYFGLPPELEHRAAHLTETKDASQPRAAELFNLSKIHQAIIPAANLMTTARDLARFYAALVGRGEIQGVRWLKPETVVEATSLHAEGPARDDGRPQRWGLGIHIGGLEKHTMGINTNPRSFGHGGYGTSIAWGDPDAGIAMAYLTSGIQSDEVNLERLCGMSETVKQAFG